MKRTYAKLIALSISSLLTIAMCEFGARLVLNPADYLSQDPIADNILGAVLNVHGSGYDEWGFRNKKVPPTVDIVAIGDSHTFGNCAKMSESWPSVLAQLTGKSVYNLALGGYGPNQYFHLFKTKALTLKPKQIICGLYFGDDFENAYLITYGLDHWAYLRDSRPRSVDFNIWKQPPSESWHKKIRTWLSRNSVVYKVVFHTSPLARMKGDVQIDNAAKLYDSATSLIVKDRNIREAFLPKGILANLDQDNENFREGMRITFQLFKEMNTICQQNDIKFQVAVIPTKEMVFSDLLKHRDGIHLGDTIEKLITNEQIARETTFKFFSESKIEYVDTLPALKNSIENHLYAQTAADMHPNKNGYNVIATEIAAKLNNGKKNPGSARR